MLDYDWMKVEFFFFSIFMFDYKFSESCLQHGHDACHFCKN